MTSKVPYNCHGLLLGLFEDNNEDNSQQVHWNSGNISQTLTVGGAKLCC